MSNQIQIKRSSTTATPSSLNPGELAYSNAIGGSGVLFIGSTDGATVVPIGGVRNPGTLTANQALVANSTSGINKVIAANVELQYLVANGSPGTSGYVLFSGGNGSNAYWAGAGGLGVNTDAQYTFTNTITFSNTITFNSTIDGTANNALYLNNKSEGDLNVNNADYAFGKSEADLNVNSASTATTANNSTYAFGKQEGDLNVNSAYSAETANNSSYLNSKLEADLNVNNASTATTANNSTYAFGKSEADLNVNSASSAENANNASYLGGNTASDLNTYSDNKAANAYSNAMSDTLSRSDTYTGNNIFDGTNTVFGSNVTFNNIVSFAGTVNTGITPTANGTQDLGTLDNRWGTLYLAGSTIVLGNTTLSANDSALQTNNLVVTANAVIANIVGTTTNISSNLNITAANIDATSATLRARDAVFSGNVTVSGTIVTINTQTLTVNDNIIELASNNNLVASDTIDFGIYAPANTSGTVNYPGFGRIAGSSTLTNPYFKIFTQTSNPNTSTTFSPTSTGTLEAYLVPYGVGGAFVANSTAVNITANGTVSSTIAANSLTLTTALAANYGGTGQSSYSTGDLLYASSSSALSKLSVPGSAANGQVLQIVNNLPAYGTLDGGTF
jgi:hypothetical protein